MDWVLYVFKRSNKHYLVPASCKDDAWKKLCARQSCSLKNTQKQYALIKIMCGNDPILKL